MQGLTRQKLEAVLYELAVLGVYGTLADFSTVIPFVIEKRMACPSEMHPYLMGPSGLQPALHYSYISETFQNPVVCHGVFAMVALREDLEAHPVRRIPHRL